MTKINSLCFYLAATPSVRNVSASFTTSLICDARWIKPFTHNTKLSNKFLKTSRFSTSSILRNKEGRRKKGSKENRMEKSRKFPDSSRDASIIRGRNLSFSA